MNILTETTGSELTARDLVRALETFSDAGDGIELLNMVRALALAPDELRRDVAALCADELARYEGASE